jgi:dUTP diphosphatase
MEKVPVLVLIEDEENLPFYGSEFAAGADLRAANKEPIIIEPGSSALIPTGLRLQLPSEYELQIRPRSGLALKSQITVLNTPGTIDADYRGEVGIILINHGKEPFTVEYGMRIAQGVVAKVVQAEFIIETALAATKRGDGGFGHSGTH